LASGLGQVSTCYMIIAKPQLQSHIFLVSCALTSEVMIQIYKI